MLFINIADTTWNIENTFTSSSTKDQYIFSNENLVIGFPVVWAQARL